jgi:hypothetical protein
LINYGRSRLKAKTKVEDTIFYVSAHQALTARQTNNYSLLEQSGIINIEKSLAKFLTQDRGKVKLLQPSREFIINIKEALTKVIPSQRAILDNDLADIEAKYEAIKPKLDILEKQKQKIVLTISNFLHSFSTTLKKEFTITLNDIRRRTPDWIDELEIESKFKTLSPKESANEIVEEIIKKYRQKVESEQRKWFQDTLMPTIDGKLEEIVARTESSIEKFYIDLDAIKTELSGLQVEAGVKDTSKAERVGAALVGFLCGNLGASYIGYQFGFSGQLAKQMGLQLVVIIGAFLGLNPFLAVGIMAAIATYGLFTGVDAVVSQIKKKIAKKIAESLDEQTESSASEMASKIIVEVDQYLLPIGQSLDSEIQSITRQMEGILKVKREGEAQVAKRRQEIRAIEVSLIDTQDNLIDLTFKIAQ